jgi:hypothetical protein
MTHERNMRQVEHVPVGNCWKFSHRNVWLNTDRFLEQYQDLSETTSAVNTLVSGLSRSVFRSDWEFCSILGSEKSLAVVYSYPYPPTTITTQALEPVFLKNSVIRHYVNRSEENEWTMSTDLINKLLEGTDYYAERSFVAYNQFRTIQRPQIPFFGKEKIVTYSQTGVAFLYADLIYTDPHKVTKRLKEIDNVLLTYRDMLRKVFYSDIDEGVKDEMRQILHEREILLHASMSNSKPLFV